MRANTGKTKAICIFVLMLWGVMGAVWPVLAEQQVCLMINGEVMHMNDEPPYYHESGQIMVPVRYIAERIGGQVSWEDSTQAVVVTFPSRTIAIKIDDPQVMVDGTAVAAGIAPHLVHSRTMVPLEFMARYFPAAFEWDNEQSILSINTK